MFLESVDLSFATDYPVVVDDHAVGTLFFRRKHAVSFLEVVQATEVPVQTSTTRRTSVITVLTILNRVARHEAMFFVTEYSYYAHVTVGCTAERSFSATQSS